MNLVATATQDDFGAFVYRVVINDVNERKCVEEKSRQFSQQIESAAVHVKSLMAEVILKNDFTRSFDNSSLTPCWELMKCTNTACRSYRDPVNLRCWEVAGTLCGGKVQGSFAQKLENCSLCEVYQRARSNPVNGLGETFNTMVTVLSDRHKELKKINQALEKSSHLAEAATLAKSEFLANMSHEIRTPIAAILGYAEVLLSEEGVEKAPEQRRKAFNTIQRNGKHLLGLINDILDLSKVESGQIQISPIRCSPCELLADVASLMHVPAAAKHLTLQTDLAGPLPETMLTDPLRLRQVLVNLVGNAIKFTEKGEVRIAVRLISCGAAVSAASVGWGERSEPHQNQAETELVGLVSLSPPYDFSHSAPRTEAQVAFGPRLRFDVTDTGIGMNEEQIGRLFQAFSQADNSSTRKFGGAGLGLCISKRLTDALGGHIEVHSTPGKGSTFSVIIDPGPLDGIRMIQNVQGSKLDRPPTTAAATPEKIELHGRILLAEDSPDIQRIAAFILKKAGAEVTLADNGQVAYDEATAARARGTPFDVILMDMQMPIMDGYEATRRLRSEGYTAPIVALTAHALAEDRQKCLDAGCDDYSTKPIDRQKLLTVVAHWLQMVPTESGLIASR